MKVSRSELMKAKSDKDKVLYILFDEGALTAEEVAEHLYETTDETPKVRVYLNRLEQEGKIEKDKSDDLTRYSLGYEVENRIQSEWQKYLHSKELQRVHEEISLNVQDRQKRLQDFIRNELFSEEGLGKEFQDGNVPYFTLDFNTLLNHDYELAEWTLENAKDALEIIRLTVKEWSDNKKPEIRVINVGSYAKAKIGGLRVEHKDKILCFDASIKIATQVKPVEVRSRWECPSCGAVHQVENPYDKSRKPSYCPCGRKSKFNKLSADEKNRIVLSVTELHEGLDRRPEDIYCDFEGELANLSVLKRVGERVQVTGHLQHLPPDNPAKSNTLRRVFHGLDVRPLDEDYTQTKITETDLQRIKDYVEQGDVLKRFAEDLYQSKIGDDAVKQGVVLQAISGVREARKEKASRGNIHVLLVGDPGTGKTDYLQGVKHVCRRYGFTTGKGSSGVGLTGSVSKDPLLGEWVAQAGELARNNDGLTAIDEFDKMEEEDVGHMHTAMENELVVITKANVKATFQTRTRILAAANPTGSSFDYDRDLLEQIALPDAIMQRFDLVFVLRDEHDAEKDRRIIEAMFSSAESPDPDYDLLRKFAIVAQRHKPVMTEAARALSMKYYLEFRQLFSGTHSLVSPRVAASIRRLSQAHARLNLRDEVVEEDIGVAYRLLMTSFAQQTNQLHLIESKPQVVSEDVLVEDTVEGLRGFLEDNDDMMSYEDLRKAGFSEETIKKGKSQGAVFGIIT